ncbi:hypothetical protein [Hyphomicrobium sp. MC1]|uniref:hypothetical protein n=1 Tax=Hyphomicrobium sp. (strain MC1) TaxID=717785 RepID=UPI000311383B|nr:hypothetical protein [Hyphomicrobium sp. MC1]
MALDERSEKIIAAVKDEIRTLLFEKAERIERINDLIMRGVGLFTTKHGRFPTRAEIDQIGETVLELVNEHNKHGKAVH